jgi:ubiquinone/menaquinone biosynthesis C-methylase UbiE
MIEQSKITKFWDDAYGVIDSMVVTKDMVVPENNFEKAIVELGNSGSPLLDYGCGGACLLFYAYFNGTCKNGIGIDPSQHVIDFLKETVEKSNTPTLQFVCGDHMTLETLEKESIGSILCSNVIDCLPVETQDKILKEFARISKPHARFLLKVNFVITKEMADRSGLVEDTPGCYLQDGVFRIASYSSETWIEKVTSYGFKLIGQDEFERIPKGPKDRMFLFEKK